MPTKRSETVSSRLIATHSLRQDEETPSSRFIETRSSLQRQHKKETRLLHKKHSKRKRQAIVQMLPSNNFFSDTLSSAYNAVTRTGAAISQRTTDLFGAVAHQLGSFADVVSHAASGFISIAFILATAIFTSAAVTYLVALLPLVMPLIAPILYSSYIGPILSLQKIYNNVAQIRKIKTARAEVKEDHESPQKMIEFTMKSYYDNLFQVLLADPSRDLTLIQVTNPGCNCKSDRGACTETEKELKSDDCEYEEVDDSDPTYGEIQYYISKKDSEKNQMVSNRESLYVANKATIDQLRINRKQYNNVLGTVCAEEDNILPCETVHGSEHTVTDFIKIREKHFNDAHKFLCENLLEGTKQMFELVTDGGCRNEKCTQRRPLSYPQRRTLRREVGNQLASLSECESEGVWKSDTSIVLHRRFCQSARDSFFYVVCNSGICATNGEIDFSKDDQCHQHKTEGLCNTGNCQWKKAIANESSCKKFMNKVVNTLKAANSEDEGWRKVEENIKPRAELKKLAHIFSNNDNLSGVSNNAQICGNLPDEFNLKSNLNDHLQEVTLALVFIAHYKSQDAGAISSVAASVARSFSNFSGAVLNAAKRLLNSLRELLQKHIGVFVSDLGNIISFMERAYYFLSKKAVWLKSETLVELSKKAGEDTEQLIAENSGENKRKNNQSVLHEKITSLITNAKDTVEDKFWYCLNNGKKVQSMEDATNMDPSNLIGTCLYGVFAGMATAQAGSIRGMLYATSAIRQTNISASGKGEWALTTSQVTEALNSSLTLVERSAEVATDVASSVLVVLVGVTRVALANTKNIECQDEAKKICASITPVETVH